MTFLPIVGRELRVAARGARAYWGRTGIAAATILVAAIVFVFSVGLPPAQTGRQIFEWLAGIMLFYCLVYGRGATADCLSQEKREGTLGLLFLTDLKGYDVVLGKLAATSVRGFYGLLAVFPVLAVPLLLGGVASGEFWRLALVLMDTFVFSLAIGMLGSALSRDQRQAMAANLNLLLLFIVIPPACMAGLAYFFPRLRPFPELLFSCPGYAFYLCDSLKYQARADHFWWTVGVIHGLTWLLLLATGWIVPRTWQDRPRLAKAGFWRKLWHAWRHGPPAGKAPFRKRALDRNAFYWLAGRARFKPVHVWTVLACIGLWWLGGRILGGTLWQAPEMCVVTALMLNFTLKVWVAIEAGQQLAEDKRTGAFEVLLTVPLRSGDIVRGQLLALRRQFLWPLLAVLGAEVWLMTTARHRGDYYETQAIWLAGMFMLAADMVALSWLGMWRALAAKSHNVATIGTVLRVMVLPWLLYGMILSMGGIWSAVVLEKGWSPGWRFCLALWTGVGLAVDLFFGLLAWWQLRTRFREVALSQFNPAPARLARWLGRQYGIMIHRWKQAAAEHQPHSTKPQPRGKQTPAPDAGTATSAPPLPSPPARSRSRLRLALAGCLGLALFAAGFLALRPRPALPPAVVVNLGQSNGPVRVFFSGHGVLLILPDQSLWRWGQAVPNAFNRAAPPQRMGTNSNWLEAASGFYNIVALRRDGTIWQWGGYGPGSAQAFDPNAEPKQVTPDHDWVSVATTGHHSVALRRDGTLWAWGENPPGRSTAGPPAIAESPTQIGTNNDWTAVCSQAESTLALRRDGTLWAWGTLYLGTAGTVSVVKIPSPTRVCRETNWTGFAATGFSNWVRNSAGELWEPFAASPNPEATAAACLRLVMTNASPNPRRFATAWCGEPKLFELCPDGSIRGRRQPMGFLPTIGVGHWSRLGKRSDWTAIWGAGSSAFGLTADGTIWTWGIDLSRPPSPNAIARIKMAYAKLATILGARPRPPGGMGYSPAYFKEPRPLMRLVGGEVRNPQSEVR